VGCDQDLEGVRIAGEATSSVAFKALGVYDDPRELGCTDFDVVVSTEVLEHLFLPKELPRFAAAVLKQNGHLIVSTPYHGYLKNLVLSVFDKWDAHWSPMWDGGHIKFWSRKTLNSLITENGFEVTGFQGVGRIPYLWKAMILVAQKR
jgi:2-polyprenyl-3-methyl-5-hydroxy-6-metoxy-1,4-benzoquinol methylase